VDSIPYQDRTFNTTRLRLFENRADRRGGRFLQAISAAARSAIAMMVYDFLTVDMARLGVTAAETVLVGEAVKRPGMALPVRSARS
jgi:hypothetical protein